ncbi:helicase C-terminal domain-containing protein [Streptomyces sp. NPDC021080]|uniref:helicase C-terminal domain-containing protein n=1 Tax=Streptomyces sp. NPDC021080 TaxID=3365110 RepID=UPI0037B80957
MPSALPGTFLSTQAVLAKALPNYRERPQQLNLALYIEHTFMDRLEEEIEAEGAPRVLMAEAGTGTGKSLAAMIPLVHASRRGGRYVVATSTIALMNQYVRTDLPMLERELGKEGIDFTWAPLKGISNFACFGPDVEVVTYEGHKCIGDLDGQTATLLDGNGEWVDCKVSEFGEQEIVEMTLTRNGERKVIETTADHRWFTQRNANDISSVTEVVTRDLHVGDKLRYVGPKNRVLGNMRPSAFGIAHGIVFGDGSRFRSTDGGRHPGACHIQLHGEKNWPLARYFNGAPQTWDEEPREGYAEKVLHIRGLPSYFKDLPSLEVNTSYLYGWLAGYFAADGSVDKRGVSSISSATREHLEFVMQVCSHLGIDHGSISTNMRVGKNLDGQPSALYTLTLSAASVQADFFLIEEHRRRWEATNETVKRQRTRRRWTVEELRLTGVTKKVYCATVPTTESFVLAGNILTGNCQVKLAEGPKIAQLKDLLDELNATDDEGNLTHTGDKDDIQTPLDHRTEWSLLSASQDECPGRSKCAMAATCFGMAHKDRAMEAGIVVTNTAVLMLDTKLYRETRRSSATGEGMHILLGDYDGLVVDEAHELEATATSHLGFDVKQGGLIRYTDQVVNFINVHSGSEAGAQMQQDKVLRHLDEVGAAIVDALGKEERATLGTDFITEHFTAFESLFVELMELLSMLRKAKIERGAAERYEDVKARLSTQGGNYLAHIKEILLAEPDKVVRWAETYGDRRREGGPRWAIKTAPIEVGDYLRKELWSRVPSVLMSATLSAGVGKSRFDYVQRSLGLEGAEILDVGTPFDYPTQAMLYVPESGVPSPAAASRDAWETWAREASFELVRMAGGGAMLLYTSRKAMNDAYETLWPRLQDIGCQSFLQGADLTNKEIAARFRDDEDSVLFGLRSFMTGMDFPGRTNRLVVVDKLPFAVPTDPIHMAREEAIRNRGGNPFVDLAIPTMTLTLEQAFGRLIRTTDDRGVVAILDSRLSSSWWGQKIQAALPPARRTTAFADVQAFYAQDMQPAF